MKETGLCPHRTEADYDMSVYSDLLNLERLCGFEFFITRSCHCPDCNRKVGGATHSAHMKESHKDGLSKAWDIMIENSHQRFLIVKFALLLGFTRIEAAPTWAHLDKARAEDGFAQEVIFLP